MTSNENAPSPAAIPRSVPVLLRHWADRAPDRSLIAVPLFHVMATNNQLLPSLYVGSSVHLDQ